jgi:hypothetical protein
LFEKIMALNARSTIVKEKENFVAPNIRSTISWISRVLPASASELMGIFNRGCQACIERCNDNLRITPGW